MNWSYSIFKEYVRFAFLTVRHRQKRSWLTVLGIFIGIAAVVGLVSISQGLKDAVVGQFESIGADTITVMAGKLGAGPPGFGSNPLTDKDVETIENVRGVSVVAPVLVRNTKVVFQHEEKYTYVMGLPPRQIEDILFTTEGLHIIEGRVTGEGDKYGAVIGYSISDGFFEKDVGIGDRLEIAGQDFRVRGRLSKIGNPSDDTQIYINIETAREIFNQPTEVSTIMVKADSSADPEKVAIDIKKALEKERGEEDFTVLTAAQLSEMVQSILGVVQIVLVGIAGISLLVGGVGIMNTMYTSVQERTRQIGIMKAIGATNGDIQLIFLIESGLLGLVGGTIGCLLGLALALGVQYGAALYGLEILKASLDPVIFIFALGFSFLIGMGSGWFPARQAAKMNPVEALRYE